MNVDDFNVEFGSDNTSVYITPKEVNVRRNNELYNAVKNTQQHSFGSDDNFYSNNNGTLGYKRIGLDKNNLLKKAIDYYNWAV